MTDFSGSEKRKYARMNANFVVSYRIKEMLDGYDLSQSKNVSQGGMLLTTNKFFPKNTGLAMTIRFPFVAQKIEVTGRVISSKEMVRDLIYETRLQFMDLNENFFKELGEFINKYLKEK